MNEKIKEALRFVLTGGVCFLVEFIALVLLKEQLGMDTMLAVPIAFTLSVIVNYLMCIAWVFKSAQDSASTKLGFLITSVIGLLLNEGLMLGFRLMWGEEAVLLTICGFAVSLYMLNKVIATVLVMVWNYFTKKAIIS